MKMSDEAAFGVLVSVLAMVLLLLLATFVIWPGNVWGGTHTERERVTGYSSDPDSTMIRVWQVGTGTQVGNDSITATFPDSFLFTLDSQIVYKLEKYEAWWGSDVWGLQSTRDINFRLIVAAAAVSDGDISTIMDSITLRHGDGSYLTGGTGTGINVIRYYAQDTSGTDEFVHGVALTTRTIIGGFDGRTETGTSGYTNPDFTSPAGSLVVAGEKPGYVWIPDTANRSGNATDTIFGYNVAIDPAPLPNFCRVYGWLTLGVGYAPSQEVTFTPKGDTTFEDCDSTFFTDDAMSAFGGTHADSVGYFEIDLRYSDCVGAYTMAVGERNKVIRVPSQATWRVVW